LKRRKLDIKWSCNVRVDIDLSILPLMKESGCRMLMIGYECLDGDTEVFSADGSTKPIRDYNINSHLASQNFENPHIVSSDGMKMETDGQFDMLKICTGSKDIIASPMHRFFTLDKNGIIEKRAKDLALGDFVATVKYIDVHGKSLNLSPELIEFLGYFTGDGSTKLEKGRYRIRLFDQNKNILGYYQKIAFDNFKRKCSIFKDKNKNAYTMYIHCKEAVELLKSLYLIKESNQRSIPEQIFSSTREQLSAYLRGLFDAEGSVSLNNRTNAIRFTSSSYKLIKQVKMALLRLDINSSLIKTQKNDFGFWYFIQIKQRDSIESFRNIVGFNHAEKKNKLERLIEKLHLRKYTCRDVIPIQIIDNILEKLYVGKGNKTNYANIRHKLQMYKYNKTTKSAAISKPKLLKLLDGIILNKDKKLWQDILFLKHLIESNIQWERIRSIKLTTSNNVYDFNVPAYNNYIANGFIVHNSGNQRCLNSVCKRATIEQSKRFSRVAHKLGFILHGCFMFGFPGETPEEAQKTIDFAKSLPLDTVQFSGITAYPGTAIYEWAKQKGYLIPKDWAEWVSPEKEQVTVLNYPQFSKEEIDYYIDKGLKEFYLRPSQIFRMMTNVRSISDIKRKIFGFRSFLDYFS
jgi:intein/homing endonuclease